ncbi:unnamed protein product [Microthlaspi erraticum]|uniref:Transmembrane protein n=1 Tax=Microthlaspi erraticum TaxID=1685480 RepID=A0A6D2HT69_9BRAS|nr:unnamed protein product [Microthlaspi erraticum]
MSGGGKGWGEAVDPFRLITTTLLSLLLPLSFLLLSRLSSSSFFLSLNASSPSSSPPLSSFFLYTNSAFVIVFVFLLSVYTLVHALATKITTKDRNRSIAAAFSPHVSVSWLILFLVQISVVLGLERTVSEGVNRIIISSERSFLIRLMFFFGLHEVMILWYRVIVRPVVDSTLLGEGFMMREETVEEKVAFAVSCGTFWWWKLRDEVESLVGAAECKRELMLLLLQIDGNKVSLDVGTMDFVNWWLYYLVVTIGVVRIVKGSLWFVMILVFEQRGRRNPCEISTASTVSKDCSVHCDDEGDLEGDLAVTSNFHHVLPRGGGSIPLHGRGAVNRRFRNVFHLRSGFRAPLRWIEFPT